MKKPEKPSRVIGYIRVSTEKQAEEGVSLDAQRIRLEAYTVAMQLTLVGIEEDAGVSAKTLDRPGLNRVLERLRAGEAEGMLIAKLDRLTRSVRDLADLLPLFTDSFALLSVGDSIDTRSASGRLVLNVLTSVSQWEREAISERTRIAMAHLKASGVQLGAPRLEGPALDRICVLRAAGGSYREIAETLTQEGYEPLRGKRWHPETVRKVVARMELA